MTEMKDKKNIDSKWRKIVDELYAANEEFDYVVVKKIAKEIKTFSKQLEKKERELVSTLEYTDFNAKEDLKKELEKFLLYVRDFIDYVSHFTHLEPRTKKGYYNYLKNAMGYL